MKKISLNGKWTVSEEKNIKTYTANVPGCVHTDLFKNKIIDDPFYGDNENKIKWIGEKNWIYSKSFKIESDFLEFKNIILSCEGLDTISEIKINNVFISNTENMFRHYEFVIKKFLKSGENKIEIKFISTFPYINKEQVKRPLIILDQYSRIPGGNRVRKAPYHYGWDWGPKIVTCGIWRPISILGFSSRIKEVYIAQDHTGKDKVNLNINVLMEKLKGLELNINCELLYENKQISILKKCISNQEYNFSMDVINPGLWWPNGLGEQNLYKVKISIYENKKEVDTITKTIGLRKIKLIREKDALGESFKFEINGIQFFAKGANWIPLDSFIPRIKDEHYKHQILSSKNANMNMLRIWGGGFYEQDIFYDLCDEYGIVVWQDFMFACSAYAAFDKSFLENVKKEAEDNIKRLRHHPCIALWCGNNEIEQFDCLFGEEPGQITWEEYSVLFDKLLLDAVNIHDPGSIYWPSCPHSPYGKREDANNPGNGDTHIWNVWHAGEPFEWYETCKHRFVSEFGFQSFPEPNTIKYFTGKKERSINCYTMEHHQKNQNGNSKIVNYMLSWFRLPCNNDMMYWLSQILQSVAIKHGAEHFRRQMPNTIGTLYWQQNDCWPVASWSSIDYFGNWKALHYEAKRFYSPVLISTIQNKAELSFDIYLTSDLLQLKDGKINWSLWDLDGNKIESDTFEVKIIPQKNIFIKTIKLKDKNYKLDIRNILVDLNVEISGEIVTSNIVYFVKPKYLQLKESNLSFKIVKILENSFDIEISSLVPALWVWPELKDLKLEYSDRFFHIFPDSKKRINIICNNKLLEKDLRKNLLLRSLKDTYE